MRTFLFILVGILAGAAIGWQLAPRMPVPRMEREELLRQRATEYYAASRRLDKWTMARLYTPARQLDAAEELRKDAAATQKTMEQQSPEVRKDQAETAAGIKPEQLEVEIEGNWAVVSGKYDLVAFGKKIPSQLDTTLWVFDDGQWWLYSWELAERNSYGHPPDFAMHLDPTF